MMPIKDKSKYPADWKEIRQRILERENNCCKICKAGNGDGVFRGFWNGIEVFQRSTGSIYRTDNGELLAKDVYAAIEPSSGDEDQKAIKIVLTIAHLNHDTSDNRDENLAALCQLHHLRHDGKHHAKNARQTIEKKKYLQRLF
jgi:hypothetical protein